MYTLIIFSLAIAASVAKPTGDQIVAVSQDTLGNYNLKYVIDGISRVENRDIHGNVVGGFSYFDPQGILRTTQFTSGVHGFNAIGTDIPQPVQDTPEVAIAKAQHLETLRAAHLSAPLLIPAEHELGFPGHQVLEIPALPALRSTHLGLGHPAPLGVPDVIPHSNFLIH